MAIRKIDVDGFKILVGVSKEDVTNAPDLHEPDQEAEKAVARHYRDRLAELGESADADAT